ASPRSCARPRTASASRARPSTTRSPPTTPRSNRSRHRSSPRSAASGVRARCERPTRRRSASPSSSPSDRAGTAMDFFAHQDRARTRSRRLVALFVLALVAVVVAVDVAAYAGWWLFAGGLKPPRFFLGPNTFVTLLIVVGGAWVETHRLRDGASALAARLGARPRDDNDPLHRRLRDVTEETAIAAGVPVPALYVLDDPSINALAAGESPALAAVLVTRGALERLERAELQGVVAHEIAHIVGGDSASNAQLAGALYGLLSLHLLGSRMLA